MTTRTRSTLLLLAAQAFWFGAAVALLAIPANGIFLAAFGARWLPATYIAIAFVGSGASVAIARSLRRWSLSSVAVFVLAVEAALIVATWLLIVATGGAWPSIAQLILFPIVLQFGFITIGGQAGRLLHLQEIKQYFPRIISGFVVGALVGGFAAAPLVDVLGAPEHLVVLAAGSLVAFLVLVQVVARRRPAELANVEPAGDGHPRPPLRQVLATRLVVLVFAYQLLSAMGSQVLDFFAFDRAAARYPDTADLTRFIALYTGTMNLVNIVFLGLAAGWLLRRFGLRLGLTANPLVITLLAGAMFVSALGPGAGSFLLFSLAASSRIIDIAATDGMTRSSINAVYQVLPVEDRTAVQASVEGVGVPVAIGVTGVMLLVVNLLDLGVVAVTLFAVVLCGAWTVTAFVTYGDYRRALGERLRHRGLDLDAGVPLTHDEQGAARRLLLTDELRDVRLGLDLAITADLSAADLSSLVSHEVPDVRLLALCQLARQGDTTALHEASETATQLAGSTDPAERRAAALALAAVEVPDRLGVLRLLLADHDLSVRLAVLGSIREGDEGVLDEVLDCLEDPATVEAAQLALGRLGPPALARMVRSARGRSTAEVRLIPVVRTLGQTAGSSASAHDDELVSALVATVLEADRETSTAALMGLAHLGASVDPEVLDGVLATEAALAACVVSASQAVGTEDEGVQRALDDVGDSTRERMLAALSVRYGADRIAGARRALAHMDQSERALGVEVFQVTLSRPHAALVEPVVLPDLDPAERIRRLREVVTVPDHDRAGWLADMVLDPAQRWRSPWLRAVALHAELEHGLAEQARSQAGTLEIQAIGDPALAEVALVAGR